MQTRSKLALFSCFGAKNRVRVRVGEVDFHQICIYAHMHVMVYLDSGTPKTGVKGSKLRLPKNWMSTEQDTILEG